MADREDFEFDSRGSTCRGWFYPAQNEALLGPGGVPVVVMAHGLGGTRDAGLEPYAHGFAEAGCAVLLFDYRGFGASDGRPRQRLSVAAQLTDWRYAVAAARRVEDADATRVVLWGTALSAGHVLVRAAADRRVAAVIAQAPLLDGRAAVGNALRRHGLWYGLRLLGAGLRDALADLAGAPAYRIAVVGRPGELAALGSEDAYDGYHAIAPPDWRNEITARSLLTLPFYRPGRAARRLACPALIQICEHDPLACPALAEAAAARIGEPAVTRHYRIGHFDIYRGAGFRQSSRDQIAFIKRALAPGVARPN